jgi:PAS domain S-box-containing protein
VASRRGRADWLVGTGEIVELIRSQDWARTGLGAIEDWPESLQTTVSLCLASSFPINVIWGPRYEQIWNEGYSRICGEKHPVALGSDYRECWASAWPAIGGAFDAACAGETAYLENQPMFLDRNGYLEETWFTFSLSPIRDDSGAIVGLFHPVTETTARMLSERRTRVLRDLAGRAARAHSVADAAAHALDALAGCNDLPFVVLFLADHDGGVRLAGQRGLDGDPGSATSLIDLLTGSGAGLIAEAMASGQAIEVSDLPARCGPIRAGAYPDATERAMLHPVIPPGAGGAVGVLVAGVSTRLPLDEVYRGFFELVAAGVTSVLANATAYEQQRARAEALAELDRAKTEFFSNVSHEFRTPLTLMLGPLEEMLARADGLEPAWREQLDAAHRNSLRLLRLVNSLLDFSRIESGRVRASYRPTDLAALTAGLAGLFRSATEQAGLALVVDCEPLPEPVLVDRDMWEKIVLNLLSNAFKHTFDGEITVSLRWIGDRAQLTVTDTGIGIDPGEIPHLFERFHRVKNARSRTLEGTGIGLSLVSDLARLHGGEVTATSEKDVGTTFTVTVRAGHAHLPGDEIDAGDDQTVAISSASAHVDEALGWLTTDDVATDASRGTPVNETEPAPRARVLIADDNADMRAHLRRLLEPRFEITEFSDGARALQAALGDPPDLVVTDVMMPALDGFGLLRALREDDRTHLVPVIMLSARAGEEAGIGGADAGADDYLVKPFSGRELIARVTRRVELAQQRRAAERAADARTVQTLEAMSDAFYTLDHETRFTYINAAGERLLGQSREALLGRRLLDAFPEFEGGPLGRARRRAASEQVTVVQEGHFAPLDKWLSARFYPTPQGVAAYVQDITEQHALRQQLLQSQKLEAVGQLASGVAHDFNNVLTVIEGYSALGQNKVAQDSEFVAHAFKEIRAASASAAALTAKLLAFSRKEPALITVADVNETVARALDLVDPLIGEDITVHRNLTPQAISVSIDVAQIEQVIVNLAVNARDAMPDGGQLHVSTTITQLDAADAADLPAGPYALIAVTDTGTGMDAQTISRIFEPFFTTKPVGKGTGLGLATASQTIRQSRGRLDVSSTPGQGTTFTICLPQLERPAQPTRQPVQPSPELDIPATRSGQTILVVEDDNSLRRLLAHALRAAGYEIVEARDRDEATHLITSAWFDLMITDSTLPGTHGIDPARAAAQHQPHMPVIRISGYPLPPDNPPTETSTPSAFLLKPFNADELTQRVRDILAMTAGGESASRDDGRSLSRD